MLQGSDLLRKSLFSAKSSEERGSRVYLEVSATLAMKGLLPGFIAEKVRHEGGVEAAVVKANKNTLPLEGCRRQMSADILSLLHWNN